MPGGVLPVKHTLEGWGFINICDDVKSNPTLSRDWGGGGGEGGRGFQLIST